MSDREMIKNKIDIVDLVREYVPIKAVGANFQGLCPFHNEKTPSFVVSPEKQIWHCFGCGKGGDIFSFVMEKENLNFVEVMRLLAKKAGITLKYENKTERSRRNRILDILDLAGKYYEHLLSLEAGNWAKKYLEARGLSSETIEEWRIGISPDAWSKLYEFLLSRPKTGKKYTDEEIAGAGLIIKKEKNYSDGRQYYDRFRNRIMFPIFDANHNLIAFTARVNPHKEAEEKLGKYINSPQSEVYDKSRVLFGLNKAKESIRRLDYALVVEGQMDVIACHNHGIENVVASSGTALTKHQLNLLKRFSSNIILAFDMDKAGQAAADKGIKEALAQGFNIKVLSLEEGKDPADVLGEDPSKFKTAINEAQLFLDYYYNKISTDLDLSVIDNKMIIQEQMLDMISAVNSPSLQGYWLKKLSEELDFSETDMREEFQLFLKTKKTFSGQNREEVKEVLSQTNLNKRGRYDLLLEIFLAILLKFPDLLNFGVEILKPEFLKDSDLKRFYEKLIVYYSKEANLDYDKLHYFFDLEDDQFLLILEKLALLGEKDYYNQEIERARQELIKISKDLKKDYFQSKIKKLEKELSLAEGGRREDNLDKIMLELKQAMDELKKLI